MSPACMKCLGFGVAILGLPLMLGTVAALQYPEGPAGAFFGRLAAYLFQLLGTTSFFRQLFGAVEKKTILDRYKQEGIDFPGMLTKHRIVSHRINCVESSQTHYIDFFYEILDAESNNRAVYKKSKTASYAHTLCRGPRWKAAASIGSLPIIPLKRLPLLPGSGYPTHYVNEELHCYWLQVAGYSVFSVALALAAPLCFLSFTEDSEIGIVVACLWALVLGVWIGPSSHKKWVQSTLYNGEVHASGVPTSFCPEAIAVDKEEEDSGTEMTKVVV